VLNLYPGRTLDKGQVSAIVHLVASSVPDLQPKNVTIVDQAGNLLSEDGNKPAGNTLDPSQLKYVQELQQNITKRIESIITPIVGQNNVRAEATADVDFSTSEQAAEIYKPNQSANSATVRSQQTSESLNGSGNTASGVPGALTNQPAPNATAPLTAAPLAADGTPSTATNPPAPSAANPATTGQAATGTVAKSTVTQRDATTNYEVDKTVRYVQQPMGGLKRLSVAVVVNYKRVVGKDGKVTYRALTEAEKTQISDLVKEAMGYSKDRGDTLNVVNSPFADANSEPLAKPPLWERPAVIDMGIQALKYLGIGIVLLILYKKMLKPLLTKLTTHSAEQDHKAHARRVAHQQQEVEPMGTQMPTYKQNLDAAKELAREDPKVVANIVKSWVGND
jgi:flagellar M-ring protein FliF